MERYEPCGTLRSCLLAIIQTNNDEFKIRRAGTSPRTDVSDVDPRAFGLLKAAYSVSETLELLSIWRTSLYAAVKRGELTPVKFRKKTLFYAMDLAAFLARLKNAALHAPSCRRPEV